MSPRNFAEMLILMALAGVALMVSGAAFVLMLSQSYLYAGVTSFVAMLLWIIFGELRTRAAQ